MAREWTGLGQVALSVADLERSKRFYRDVLGLASNGGTTWFDGRTVDEALGVADVDHELAWLSDRDPRFQLELVRFDNPPHRPRPNGASEADLGFRRLGLWVADFSAVLERAERAGFALVAGVSGELGRRRACLRDPDAVVVELLEEDPDPPLSVPPYRVPARVRSVTLSVSDLALAEAYFRDVLGMPLTADIHQPEMEASWGLAGAERATRCFSFGEHVLEVVQYTSPRGAPRPADAHVGDAGIYHVALTHGSCRGVRRTWQAHIDAGYSSKSKPIWLGLAALVYLQAPENAVFECLQLHPWVRPFVGYRRLEGEAL